MSEPARHWTLCPAAPAEAFARFRELPPVIVQLLHNRGIVARDAAEAFLAEKPPQTSSPFLMAGMEAAVDRLALAAANAETVAIYGDFDVDGVTAAALLVETFSALGIKTIPYIPTRAEGYGMSVNALGRLAREGIRLVITTDCGINSADEVAFAGRAGLDVIVTDHHRLDGEVPSAVAVINPRQPSCRYPFKDLAAVGVAFKVAHAALVRLPLARGVSPVTVAEGLLDLVALGTVADVVPLVGENRALLRHGLGVLNKSSRRGLRALIARSGLDNRVLTAGHIGFSLAPRLNAAGRVSDAEAAYRLLLTKEEDEATALALELEQANEQRQRLMADCIDRARLEILAADGLEKVLFVGDVDFPPGIVGLVAGRLAEEFHRPAFVVSLGDDECRGSARSIAGFNVVELLASCRDLLVRFGGHAQAAGFTVDPARVPALKQRLLASAEDRLDESLLRRRLSIDAELPLSQISDELYEQLCRLAPFGFGNPTPLFLARGTSVLSASEVGREPPKHLKLQLHDGVRRWPAIAFRRGDDAAQLARKIDIVYTVAENHWNGRRSLELQVKDWRAT